MKLSIKEQQCIIHIHTPPNDNNNEKIEKKKSKH